MKRKARQSAALRWLASALCGLALAACADESRLEESLILDTIMQGAEGPDLLASSEYAASAATIARANRNKRIVSCYARLAEVAYETPTNGMQVCAQTNTTDARNGMGAWQFAAADWQPAHASTREILQFWLRETDERVEMAIVLRGTASGGDIVQDAKSQTFVAAWAEDNEISRLVTNPRLPDTGANRRFHAGFYGRVKNLAWVIDNRLHMAGISAQGRGKRLGIKIVGHSLGAATATIVGTYVANRYWDSQTDVEVFAFNSPKAVNSPMAKWIRNAASYCRFNFHVFNNARDKVSALPWPGAHIYSSTRIVNEPNEVCQYEGMYTQNYENDDIVEAVPGFHWRKPLEAFAWANAQHRISQWILGRPDNHIIAADDETAARWFPERDQGATTPSTRARRLGGVEGVFTASLVSHHLKFVSAENNGNGLVTNTRTTVGTSERFRFIPDDSFCARHGDHIVLATTGNPEYFFRSPNGPDERLDVKARASTLDIESSFTLINHTSTFGCLKSGDSISLRAHSGRYLSAIPAANDQEFSRLVVGGPRTISAWEKFTVTGVQDIVARKDYDDSRISP